MARHHWQDFPQIAKNHFEKHLGQPLFPETRIVLSDGQVHKFDLASADRSILIECKSYTYTETGNEPAAKLPTPKPTRCFSDRLPPAARSSCSTMTNTPRKEVWRDCLPGAAARGFTTWKSGGIGMGRSSAFRRADPVRDFGR
jgi:hypothetical protein